jgi:hypothetical protein
VFAALAEALLIAAMFIFLSEHFGWHLLSEAGGSVVRGAL